MSGATPRIVLALGNTRLTVQYTEVLVAAGYEVYQCGEQENILQAVLDHRPALIILDTHRPGTSGYDLIEIMHHTPETEHVQVILLESVVSHANRERAKHLGASGLFINSVGALPAVVTRVCKLVLIRSATSVD